MSSSTQENSHYARIIAILKEIDKENLLEIFQKHELSDDVLDSLAKEEMRNELREVNISRGSEIKFRKAWFSRKKSGAVSGESVGKQSVLKTTTISEDSEQRKKLTHGNHFEIEEHPDKLVTSETIAPLTGARETRKASLKGKITEETKVDTKESETGGSRAEETKKEAKTTQPTSSQAKSDCNIVLEPEDGIDLITKAADSKKKLQSSEPTRSNEANNQDENSNVIEPSPNCAVEETSKQKSVDPKHSKRRPFGQPTEKFSYEKGTVFSENNVENRGMEYKAFEKEKPSKLPWKIIEKARTFICGVLNAGEHGTIYFGIGDSCDNKTNYAHGEIIGLEVEDFKDEISKTFQSMLDDHIKSDNGKMTKGGDMNCVKIHFVPVHSLGSINNTGRYVVEIEVKREWKFCKNQVYYVEEWSKKNRIDEKKPVHTYGLHDLFKKGKDEAYFRACGATQLVKSSDIVKDIKDPLSLKYKEWQDEKSENQLPPLPNEDAFNSRLFSSNVHKSLRELNSKENDYILVANKTPPKYRGNTSLAFLQAIPWTAVFDLFDLRTKEDGLYFILNKTKDSQPVLIKELGDFKQTEEKSAGGRTWILRNEKMHESQWIHNSKDCLYQAMSTYHKGARKGRIHCVFLLLCDENLREVADIIDSCVSIIGANANKCITILSEQKEVGVTLTKMLHPEVRKDVIKEPCSILGFHLEFLRKSVEEMLGDFAYEDANVTTELPFWSGKYKPILNRRINSLTDLEVYLPKPKLSSSYKEIKAARDNFYKGDVIKQVNLNNRDDIERTLAVNLTQVIEYSLKQLSLQSPEDTTCVEVVSLSYESGSGATTLGRRVLWDKRCFYRCAVVKAISDNTYHQIQELQSFGYETFDHSLIPAVLILVDNEPEHDFNNLRDKLSQMNTKCVLLHTIPIAITADKNSDDNCLKLGKLDSEEIERVKSILANMDDKDEKEKDAAVEKVEQEKRFIWLGLQLFGRQYKNIWERLSEHINHIISHNLTDQLKSAYGMILRFCCLLDYYSKGRSIYPHPCIADILYQYDDLESDDMNQIDKIHEKFGGLLLEDYSEGEGYHGWRPAHFLVAEVVHKEMNFIETAKMLVTKMNSGNAYANTYLINNAVNVFLQREKRSESSSQNIATDLILDDISGEDEFDSLEVKTTYSALVMAAMLPNEDFPRNVIDALDLLISLIENVNTTQHKARTCQQIARVFAYKIGMREISEKSIVLLVRRINEELRLPDESLNCSGTNGFAIAHRVIDHAIELQNSFVNHLVTKATFFKVKLGYLYECAKDIAAENKQSNDIMLEAISTIKEGIQAYDNALKKSPNGYLHAMVGKVQAIIVLLQIFKAHSCFTQSNEGPDECFKNYVTYGVHPAPLKDILTEDDLNFFFSLANKVIQHLNELFGELKLRKRQYGKYEQQELINAKIRAMGLRKTFYQVTQRNRRNKEIANVTGCEEDIVHDLLFDYDENAFSTWKKLPDHIIAHIHTTLKDAISKGRVTMESMLICARAALEEGVDVDELFNHIEVWKKYFPKSLWCHLFNYMIHFPVPNGTLKPDVQIVKQSVDFCKNNGPRIRNRYRKSGAEYLLGRGTGLKVILSSHKVSSDSVEHKIDFWRSLELYDKLERLCGQKVLGRKGVLLYKGIEITFDNDRYPKESRDELWFCLGFTLNGPYAYDPMNDDTYKGMKKELEAKRESGLIRGFITEMPANSSESCPGPMNAWSRNTQATIIEAKPACDIKTSQPDRGKEKLNPPATKLRSEIGKAEPWRADKSKSPPRFITEGVWKSNKKLVIRKRRSEEGHQVTFKPVFLDEEGKIHHGAVVKGAPKTSVCRRHAKRSPINTKSCTFAHPWVGDFVSETVCEVCTKDERFFCAKGNEHKQYIYELGKYLNESGEIWSAWENEHSAQ